MTATATSGGFDVQPETIGAAAETFEAQSQALDQAVQALQARLSLDGACWGSDSEGAIFGSMYQPGATQMLSDLDDLVKGIAGIADALQAVSAKYLQADQASSGTPSTTALT